MVLEKSYKMSFCRGLASYTSARKEGLVSSMHYPSGRISRNDVGQQLGLFSELRLSPSWLFLAILTLALGHMTESGQIHHGLKINVIWPMFKTKW